MNTPQQQNASKTQALRRITQLKQAQAYIKASRIKFLMMKPKPRIRCETNAPNNIQNLPDDCQDKDKKDKDKKELLWLEKIT